MRPVIVTALLAALAIGATPRHATAQDTLSDAAWKADMAKRAAQRRHAEETRDSVSLLVDTLVVSPAKLEMRVGDTVSSYTLLHRLKVTGKRRTGELVTGFATVFAIDPRTMAVQSRDGQVVALAPGEATVFVWSRKPVNPFDDTPPVTKVKIIVQ